MEILEKNTMPLALPEGTVIEKYTVGEVLFENEESILYSGKNTETGEDIWLREFFPKRLASRDEASLDLVPKEEDHTRYKLSMAAFEDLFQTVKNAGKQGNIVPIEEILHIHNTIYIINIAFHAETLLEYQEKHEGSLSWTEVKKRMMPLLNSIAILHGKGVIHLGISPISVLLSDDHETFLRGFSTLEARTEDGELGSERFSGFSSPEQYESGPWKGGPWSDVYALGAVMYWLLTGVVPQDARERMENDTLVPASELNSSIPENVSDAISGAMMLDPDLRTASVDDFTSALLESVSGNTAIYEVPDTMPNENTVHLKKEPHFLHILLTTLLTIAVLGGVAYWAYRAVMESQAEEKEEVPAPEIQQETVLVPDFEGHNVHDIVENELCKEQFSFEIQEEYSESYPAGIVISQSPAKGTSAAPMSEILLTVSKGNNQIDMPNLIGYSLEEAKQILDESQITYAVYVVENKDYTGNTVFRTDPPEGTKISIKDTSAVKIYVTPEEKKSHKNKSSRKSREDD